MKVPNNLFSDAQINELKKVRINIDFSKDYSDDDLFEIEDNISNELMTHFDKNGEPLPKCDFWEDLFDTYHNWLG